MKIENFKYIKSNNSDLIEDYGRYSYKRTAYPEKRTPIGFQFSEITNEQKPEAINIEIKILEDLYSVPNSFKDFVSEINNSKYILNLEDDWDGMGAIQISPALYKKAIDVLLMYSVHIFKEDNKTVILPPEINPCPNGTIDFSWTTKDARMLINVRFKNDDYIASCFGYSKTSNIAIEGLIDMKNVDNDVASWMKKLKN